MERKDELHAELFGCLKIIEKNVDEIRQSTIHPQKTNEYFSNIIKYGDKIHQTICSCANDVSFTSNALVRKLINHEFGVPLNGMIGFSQLYADENYIGRTESLEFLDIANPSIHVLKRLFNLLNLRDLSINSIRKEAQNVNLEELAREEVISTQHLLKQNNQGMYFSCPTGLSAYTNAAILSTLLSVHNGDSAKWGLPYQMISHQVKEEDGKLSFSWENSYGKEPIEESIGLNEGIGTSFTEYILEQLDAEPMETYDSSRIEIDTNGKFYGNIDALFPSAKIYGKRISIPLENLMK